MHSGIHPAIIEWWQARRQAACGGWGEGADASASCGPGGGGGRHRGWGRHGHPGEARGASGADDGEGDGGGHFGVRRPLRFLAYKLDLDERQVGELARILDVLKTERAQAEVDRRRTVSALADAIAGDAFDGAKADEGAKLRVSSAERLRDAVIKALQQIHAVLDAEQRAKLAYLIRTGTLSI
jgi:Spy/CpxP family protein refolding chaperone